MTYEIRCKDGKWKDDLQFDIPLSEEEFFQHLRGFRKIKALREQFIKEVDAVPGFKRRFGFV